MTEKIFANWYKMRISHVKLSQIAIILKCRIPQIFTRKLPQMAVHLYICESCLPVPQKLPTTIKFVTSTYVVAWHGGRPLSNLMKLDVSYSLVEKAFTLLAYTYFHCLK